MFDSINVPICQALIVCMPVLEKLLPHSNVILLIWFCSESIVSFNLVFFYLCGLDGQWQPFQRLVSSWDILPAPHWSGQQTESRVDSKSLLVRWLFADPSSINRSLKRGRRKWNSKQKNSITRKNMCNPQTVSYLQNKSHQKVSLPECP